MRLSWCALMPFLLAAIRWKARTHFVSGTWLRSMTEPFVTVKWPRQALHWWRPGRCDWPCSRVMPSTELQCGQNGLFGQRIASMWARAASSS